MNILTGIVVSVKNAKTAKVAVTRIVAHPIYKKRVKRTRNYLVHDEVGVKLGQKVQFVPCKPYSKMKRWTILEKGSKKTKEEKKSEPTIKKMETKVKKTDVKAKKVIKK